MHFGRVSSALLIVCACLVAFSPDTDAKKHAKSFNSRCLGEECELSPQHFALYSAVKRALDSEFNLNGKEIVPMLRSVEILRKRFDGIANEQGKLNGTNVVETLLNNNTLKAALKVLNSDEGRELITFYRASVNGRGQNLACSQMRIQDLERVTAKVESNWELKSVFKKINKNYLKKSAKKCLKHSCTSIELAMTRLDSILGKQRKSGQLETTNENSLDSSLDQLTPVDEPQRSREFYREELELCKFFKRTNETDCKISGTELGELNFDDVPTRDKDSILVEHLRAYAANNMDGSGASLENASKAILSRCRPMVPLLEYNLTPIKWYRERGLIDQQKLASRAFWCKGLSYWFQIDRLCGELEGRLQQIKLNNQVTTAQPLTETTTTTMAAAVAAAITATSTNAPSK